MNATAVIDRFAIRWQVTQEPGAGVEDLDPARFDGLAAGLLDGPLEDALAALGIGSDEEVCLRRVVVPPVAMRWGQPDNALLDQWSRAIGAAVRGALIGRASGDDHGADVVHYRSLSHARSDLVVGVLSGDLTRMWAWRQLGLWPADLVVGETNAPGAGMAHVVVDHLLRELDEEPALIVPTFVRLAEHLALREAITTLGADAVVRLADRAWRSAGGGRLLAPWAGPLAGPTPLPLLHELGHRAARGAADAGRDQVDRLGAVARALAARSRLGAAVAAGSRYGEAVRRALAALVVLEAEPAAARGGRMAGLDGDALVAAAAAVLDHDGPGGPGGPGGRGGDAEPTARAVAQGSSPAPEISEPTGAEPGDGSERDLRDRPARSGCAGLLFLLRVLDELDVPSRLLADERAGSAGLRRRLHALGAALLRRCQEPGESPVADNDPALLAFCGLRPDDDPPAPVVPDHDDGVHAAVEALAGEVAASVAERIDGPDTAAASDAPTAAEDDAAEGAPSETPDPASGADPASGVDPALAHVCRRPGEVVADPGWFDVVLDLAEVCTDVRRAGLDLDPGYLWWLGAVVRFRYV